MEVLSRRFGHASPFRKKFVYVKECLRRPRVILWTILSLVGFKNRSFIGNFRLIEDFHYSISSSQQDLSNHYKNWKDSDYLFAQGEYHNAIMLRKEILRDLHVESDYPPIMPETFSISIGHLALSYLHKLAIEASLLVKGPRFHLFGSRCANLDAFKFVSQGNQVIKQHVLSFTGSLMFSPIAENLTMFRGIDDFFDIYELWERIGSLQRGQESLIYPSEKLPIFKSKYLERETELLNQMGISNDRKIALLHVRDTGNIGDTRNANIEHYSKAIRELIRNDFVVIRIGDSKMPSIKIEEKGFFDFTKPTRFPRISDFFLFSRCDAFIGTTSGPFGFPLLFGKPTLVTNLTSISRNSLSGNKSIYVPKKIVTRGSNRVWTLEEMLKSKLSFGGEYSHSQLARQGLTLLENTEEEILEATKDLMRLIESDFSLIDSRMDTVNRIRKEARSVSYGDFASSFLDGMT